MVKDKADKLLSSILPYVDEVVVVGDKKLLERNIKGNKVKIYDYKWIDDFADARNFADSKATNDIILTLDADDTVIHPEKLPELAKGISSGQFDWIHLEYLYEKDEFGNVLMRQYKPRLYRKGTGVWKKSVHEVLEPTISIVSETSDEVTIDHHTEEGHKDSSAKRNLRILLKEFNKDKDKTDPRTLYYLGNTYLAMEDFEKAIPFFAKHIQVCGWPEEKYFSMHYLAHCYSWLGKIDNSINIALEMTKVFPNWSLAYYDLGEFYSNKEDYKRTIEWILTGLTKNRPNSKAYSTSDLDYGLFPMARLTEAYLYTLELDKALALATRLAKEYPGQSIAQELYEQVKKTYSLEGFVKSFINVANTISKSDRIKSTKLFDVLPNNLDSDIRIQEARFRLIPPKTWEDKSIVIYCGKGNGEEWAYPSIFSGIGGSEEAVINMGQELTKLGYKVTVYNCCGDLRGEYMGVKYIPYYHFNSKDKFNTLIAWRTPSLFNYDIEAKQKIVWLHDIAYPTQFSAKCLEQTDKFIFLSKWHRENMPSIPDSKIFISNNGIDPNDFKNIEIKKKPNSLFWGSSYDRGLLCLVRDILPLVKKEIPDVTLDVCYGWENIDREIKAQPGIYPELEVLRSELTPLLNQKGITHHGRVSHAKLADIMASCQVHSYPSEFGETNNITIAKAQSAGCYAITTTQAGGSQEKVIFGKVIKGENIYHSKKLQKQFAEAIVEYLKKPKEFGNRNKYIQNQSWKQTATTWQKDLLC